MAAAPRKPKPPAGPMTLVQIGLMCDLLMPDREAHQVAALMRKAFECTDRSYSAKLGGKVRTNWQPPLVRTQQVHPQQYETGDPYSTATDGEDQPT